MTEGTSVPIETSPSKRLDDARKVHARAVKAYEDAQRAYVEEVNALPLPALMRGGKVRVTDADQLADIIVHAREAAGTADQADRHADEIVKYREKRRAIAESLSLGHLAEAVVDAAAEMIRLTREA